MARKAKSRMKATTSNHDQANTQSKGPSEKILEDINDGMEHLDLLNIDTQIVGDGGFGEILSPTAALNDLQLQSATRRLFSEWLSAVHSRSTPIPWVDEIE
ncbi:hypothetical protein SOVF_011650, partial [Spinacia oleracea]